MVRLIKRKREEAQITKVKIKTGISLQILQWGDYEQLYANNYENINDIDNFLYKYNLSKMTVEIENHNKSLK